MTNPQNLPRSQCNVDNKRATQPVAHYCCSKTNLEATCYLNATFVSSNTLKMRFGIICHFALLGPRILFGDISGPCASHLVERSLLSCDKQLICIKPLSAVAVLSVCGGYLAPHTALCTLKHRQCSQVTCLTDSWC